MRFGTKAKKHGKKTGHKIGLFGGSFNPAHSGHLHLANTSLKSLGLDEIWWLVSPQNPLKNYQGNYSERVKTVEKLGLPPNMKIKHIERDYGTNYTIDTLSIILKHWPNKNFVFLIGADNLAQLPKWKDWKTIFKLIPLAVISRPGEKPSDAIRARLSLPAKLYANSRIAEHDKRALIWQKPPAWIYITSPLNPLSSTKIRSQKQ